MKTGSSKKIKRLKITASANDYHGAPETSARITCARHPKGTVPETRTQFDPEVVKAFLNAYI